MQKDDCLLNARSAFLVQPLSSEALTESLRQRMVDYQQSTATSGTAVEISPESEEERYYASYYERHEAPETINAFLRILRSMPVERAERTPVYTDEELEAFS